MSKGPRAMATCYERPGPPPERSRLAPGAAARRRSGSGRSLGGPAMGMSKHAGAADLSGGVVSLAGGGRRVRPRRSPRPRRATSRLSFCVRPKRLSSARKPPSSLRPSSVGASSSAWRRTRSPRVRLFFVDGFFTYSWAFLLADGHFSVRFARGQRPGQRPPASFGRPARPDHGARTLRSSPPPPWTFARRFGTLPWEGRCLCDGRSSDDEVLGTCLLGRVGCHQRSSSHGPTLPPCW